MSARPASTVGSPFATPSHTPGKPPRPHVGGVLAAGGVPEVTIEGQPIAVVGTMGPSLDPPYSVTAGSLTVTAGGLPVARLGDPVVAIAPPGVGTISGGSSTVQVG